MFPKEQAERIKKRILNCIDTENWGAYAVDEVEKYGEKFQKDTQNINAGGNPLSSIPSRLLHRWLGDNINNFEVKSNGQKTGIVSPLLVLMTIEVLISFLGSWKRIKDEFNLIEGDENIS